MTDESRRELRVTLQQWFCGCGNPGLAAERLRDLLALHPLYEHRVEFEQLVPDDGIQYLLLYMLDRLGLTEHGGNVGGGWLTEKGRRVLATLSQEGSDGLDTLMDQQCMHGYDIDEPCPLCAERGKLALPFVPTYDDMHFLTVCTEGKVRLCQWFARPNIIGLQCVAWNNLWPGYKQPICECAKCKEILEGGGCSTSTGVLGLVETFMCYCMKGYPLFRSTPCPQCKGKHPGDFPFSPESLGDITK